MPPWEHVDPVGLVAITSYNDAVAGGATETAAHDLDRQVASLTGSAIVQESYDCGVEAGLLGRLPGAQARNHGRRGPRLSRSRRWGAERNDPDRPASRDRHRCLTSWGHAHMLPACRPVPSSPAITYV